MDKKLKAELDAAAAEYKNVMRRPWTAQEKEAIKMYYGKVPVSLLAAKLGRTITAIHNTRAREVSCG